MIAKSLFAAAALALATVPAVADTVTLSIPVRIADLDLASAKDQARLDGRIRKAADGLCRAGAMSVRTFRDDAGCRANSIRDARLVAKQHVELAMRRQSGGASIAAR